MGGIRPLLACSLQCARQTAVQRRFIQTSISKSANPIPHPAAPGPPPPAPIAAATQPDERVARKRKQAEILAKSRAAKGDASKPGSALKRRFWKDVAVKETPEGLQVHLDTRPVRTSSKEILHLPAHKHHLATAIALEWDQLVSAQQSLKQYYIPLTSLASRAIDIQTADRTRDPQIRDQIMKMLMRYLSTDTLLCWVPEKNIHDPAQEGRETLRAVQMRMAQGIIGHLTATVWPGVDINPVLSETSILPAAQPRVTEEVIRGWIAGLPAFELAGLERAVLATKSLLVAVRLLADWSRELNVMAEGGSGKKFGISEAAEACTLEVRWQTGQWGEVEDTHDVEKEDLTRQLGSVVLLVS